MSHSKRRPWRDAGDDETARRRKFSEQMAKSVFGRHYWNDLLQQEMQQALTRRKNASNKQARKKKGPVS